MLKQKIIERHGRIENIELYDNEPNKEELAEMKRKMKEPKALAKQQTSNYTEADDDESSQRGLEKKKAPQPEQERPWSFKMLEDDSKYLHQIFGGFTGVKTK